MIILKEVKYSFETARKRKKHPMKDYSFAEFGVWATQGGGLVKKEGDFYVFIEVPEGMDLKVGDPLPNRWDTAPANRQAMYEDSPYHPSNPNFRGTLSDAWKKPSSGRGISVAG
jgi:hypothetical protein